MGVKDRARAFWDATSKRLHGKEEVQHAAAGEQQTSDQKGQGGNHKPNGVPPSDRPKGGGKKLQGIQGRERTEGGPAGRHAGGTDRLMEGRPGHAGGGGKRGAQREQQGRGRGDGPGLRGAHGGRKEASQPGEEEGGADDDEDEAREARRAEKKARRQVRRWLVGRVEGWFTPDSPLKDRHVPLAPRFSRGNDFVGLLRGPSHPSHRFQDLTPFKGGFWKAFCILLP